ncbi:glycosyltransferase family 2 protein [Patescibacteria group bacterium]|nr:glycosyltransferase family 2 protein [Patescibacteria group bacterium]
MPKDIPTLENRPEEITDFEQKFKQASRAYLDTKLELDQAKDTLNRVLKSKSWRITKPLRVLQSFAKKTPSRIQFFPLGFFIKPLNKVYIKRHLNSVEKEWPKEPERKIHFAPAMSALSFQPSLLLSEKKMDHSTKAVKDMKYKPLISIVLCVEIFDEILFRRALNSVAEQTYCHWEMIIVDHTNNANVIRGIINDYQKHYSNNFTFMPSGYNSAVSKAKGGYLGFLWSTDTVELNALEKLLTFIQRKPEFPDVAYTDHSELLSTSDESYSPIHKPDWSNELLLSYDYVRSFLLAKTSLLKECMNPKDLMGPAYTYDLLLRISEKTNKIMHVPVILYHRHRNFPYKFSDAKNEFAVLREAIKRRGLPYRIEFPLIAQRRGIPFFKIYFTRLYSPKVTIIIPTKDNPQLLRRCIGSIRERTDYPNYEIVIINNGSKRMDTIEYLRSLPERVIDVDTINFNFAHINNQAVNQTDSDLILFLNDDAWPVNSDWLREMVGIFSLDEKIGVVGPKLLYPQTKFGNKVQSAGMVIGRNRASLVQFTHENDLGYNYFNHVMRNCSASGGACMLTRRSLFNNLGGYDENNFAIDFCDVDYCLRAQKAGYRTVFTPHSQLYHDESATRGDNDGKGASLDMKEAVAFEKKWGNVIKHDPYYNPNLSLSIENNAFSLAALDSHKPHQ